MDTLVSPGIEIRPLPQALGGEIVVEDLRRLDAGGRAAIRQAWLDNLVLLIRGQAGLSPYDLVTFAESFGEIALAAPNAEMPADQKDRFDPRISIVSNIRENGVAVGSLGDGELFWHSDHSYHSVPIAASALIAMEIPPRGGETGFINMYQALETLPAPLRERLRGLTFKHDGTYNSAGQIRRGLSPVTDVRTSPGVIHPAVRTHPETGHDALYLGRRPHAYVMGLPVEESEALLDQLWAHIAALPAWYHEWRVGDIVVWDNRCVMHRRHAFDKASRRLLYRAQTQGTPPALDPAGHRRPHPRSRHQA